jgi:hypothetical protein
MPYAKPSQRALPARLVLFLLVAGLVAVPATALAKTYYVDPVAGNDQWTSGLAQYPSFPWKTVKRALGVAQAGDVVLVKATGTIAEAIESRRDGTATAPITLRCMAAGACTVQPPAGANGVFVSHNYFVLDGFKIQNASIGVRYGAHDGGDGPLFGGIVQNNIVQGSTSNGVQCAN